MKEEEVEVVVQKTLEGLGIDITNLQEVRTFQANMAWVYRFRKRSEKIGTAIQIAFLTAFIGGGAALIFDMFKIKGGN